MEKLLQWSTAHENGDQEAIKRAGAPDPRILAQLFGKGGPDEPTLMKEAMIVLTNPEATLENRLIAFENFEMLIENLDNANNIENMKMWPPLLKFLTEESQEEDELVASALSVIGTAVQNNINSQEAFMKYDNSLKNVIKYAGDSSQPFDVRVKAFYALSNLLRHNPKSCHEFVKLGGLSIVAPVLTDPSVKSKLKLRALSAVSALLTSVGTDHDMVQTMRELGIVKASIISLSPEEKNIYVLDKVLNLLSHFITAGVKFTEEELSLLREHFESIKPLKERLNEDDYLTVKHVL